MSGAGGLDIRQPIGALFFALGVLLGSFGLATRGDAAQYQRSLGLNLNLYWGVVMLAFGLILLAAARRATKQGHPSGVHPTEDSPEGRATEGREHRAGLERER